MSTAFWDTPTVVQDLSAQLQAIYGDQAVNQRNRYADAIRTFRQRFGDGPVDLFRAPGRINLIGGHTDYNHGYVMPVALDRDLVLVSRPRNDRNIVIANTEPKFEDNGFEMSSNIPSAPNSRWSNYVRGAAEMVVKFAPETVCGMDCLVVGASPYGVPRGSGVSSSSALTVAATIALFYYAHMQRERDEFVQICSDAEWYVGTRGGIMDQFISLGARRGHALFLDCRPSANGAYTTQQVPLPSNYDIIIAESGVRHDNVRGEYNKRVAACRTGVRLLQDRWPTATHLRDLENVEWNDMESYLPETCSVDHALTWGSPIDQIPGLEADDKLRVRNCCRHVWQENRRVKQALAALTKGNVAQAGKLIAMAHASARDNYDISCSEMETLIQAASTVEGVVGGRITGAGWGGCAVFLVQRSSVSELQQTLETEFEASHGCTPVVYPCKSGSAAGYIATLA